MRRTCATGAAFGEGASTQCALWLLASLVFSAPCGAVRAQDRAPLVGRCDGMVVTEVVVTARDPSFLQVPRRLRGLARGVGLIHTTSKEEVIRRFLLLDVGRICTERRRAESERILRLQPFLAAATVRAVSDAAGGVRIEVESIDEIPTVFGMSFRDKLPSALRFGNGNVGGRGLHLAVSAERGFAYRTGVGVEAVAYQVFSRPYTLALVAERAPLGTTLTLALGHPFFTDLQRTAWHVGYGEVNRYARFRRPQGNPLSLSIQRRFSDLGGVRRIGIGRHSAFLGGLLTYEGVTPAARAVVVSDSGLVADTSGALDGPSPAYQHVRLNAVIGVRALSFMPVYGFDALRAVQDVATGAQVGVLMGHGIPRLGSTDDGLFVFADFYAGAGSPRSFSALRARGEVRMNRLTGRWDSMVGSGRGALGHRHAHPTRGHREAHSTRAPGAGALRRRGAGLGRGFTLRGGQPNDGRCGVWASGGLSPGIAADVAPGSLVPREFGFPGALGDPAHPSPRGTLRAGTRDVALGRAGAAPSAIFTWQ